jgi:serine/threonine protein kinase
MIKAENRPVVNEPVCKKIQNYIFKFSDLLGQGNFSKVYKAHHEITSKFHFNEDDTVAIKII